MKPVFSVVIPCYNEQEVLSATWERLHGVMEGMGEPYELIFINDGSRDNTTKMLRELAAEHPLVRALHFARNFGQQYAVTAGLDAARGDAVVIIDADLQDPPEVIPQMAEKWRAGADVVYGKRMRRAGETAFKKLTAWGFYRTLRSLVGFDIPADTGDFRLVSRRALDVIRAMPEHNRFLRGMFAWVGFNTAEVGFEREKRFAGETKYPLRKMLRLAMDGVLSFSRKPFTWVTWAGGLFAGLGAAGLLGLGIAALAGAAGLGMWLLAGLMVFLSGCVLTGVGVVGAYVGRIYDEAIGRPLYIVADRDNEPGDA
ncbi:MAG: glycosyltransferase family 2 protein [Oscillospiraceae bacterium]|jgi:dolichol-phosphate mannosyltransferase|nr:glycosyltransferase family 2 protein [Oscillospiraceae bacterium]